jgi:hypothetical protein
MIRNHAIAGVEEIDKATLLGLRFMKKLVEKASIRKKSTSSKPSLV